MVGERIDFMLFTNNSRGRAFAKDPAVVKLGDKYFLYHTIPPYGDGRTPDPWGIGIAVSSDMVQWSVVGSIPIEQECEKNGIAAPGAILLDGTVHLFYQTYGNMKTDAICHAVSKDGINFEKDKTNPVYSPKPTWCCGRAIDADVCVFQNRLFMYFATRDHAMKIQKIGVATADLSSDFSRSTWSHACSAAILSPELLWEKACIEAPATIVNDNRIFMFYGGAYNCEPQQIGCAVSDDGIHFERVSEMPFLPNGEPGDWNESESGHPFAFRDTDGKAYLFYQGSNDKGKTWYISKRSIF